ncbi:hypothetical protein AgCh_017363 [Apium graveolens]
MIIELNMDEIMDEINVDSFELKPGPRDTSILYLQSEHRSSTIWNVGGGNVLRTRVRNLNSNRFPSLHPRMVPLLTDVGFDGVARLTRIQTDWSLVTALVERWRPETHIPFTYRKMHYYFTGCQRDSWITC